MSENRKRWIGIGGAIAGIAVIAIAAGIWYMHFSDDAPPPVSIEEAVGAIYSGAASTPEIVTPGMTSTDTSTPGTTDPANGSAGLDGEWAIADTADRFIGYRIGQELVSIGANEVVGRTSAVEGSATIDGLSLTTAEITADLTGLESGESLRDNTLRSQALEIGQFPTATFELTEPVELPEPLLAGEAVSFVAHGDLTLHGVTQPVDIPLEVQSSDGMLVVVGAVEIVLEDYDMEAPNAPVVASVDDRGMLEIQLFFTRL